VAEPEALAIAPRRSVTGQNVTVTNDLPKVREQFVVAFAVGHD
jgi:hypothetical protein